MAYLVAPGNHIAPLGDTSDATVGSDAGCTLGIRGDYGLEPVHFHIFRSAEGLGAKLVPADPTKTPVCLNEDMVPPEGKLLKPGDTILAGFIELEFRDDDEVAPASNPVPEQPPAKDVQPVSAFFEPLDQPEPEKHDPVADLLHSPRVSTSPVPAQEAAPREPVAPDTSHLPSAAAPNAPAAVPAAKAGGNLHLPQRTAPPLASAAGKTLEALKRNTVRWAIRAAVATFFLAVGSSLLNARFPAVQSFWSGVGLKVKHVLEPPDVDPRSYGRRNQLGDHDT